MEAFVPIGDQTFVPTELPATFSNMVKSPNVAYPVGNGTNYAHARMDVKEICYLLNRLAETAGVYIVAELPDMADAEVGIKYRLSLPSLNESIPAPPGEYIYTGSGWVCVECYDMYPVELGATVDLALIPGAMYRLTVTEEITSLAITPTAAGPVYIVLINPSTYAVAEPTEGYTRTAEGLTDLGEENVEIQIMSIGSDTIWSCVALEAIV